MSESVHSLSHENAIAHSPVGDRSSDVPNMQVLALADDLTGALEAGAKLSAPVHFAGSRLESPALVIDTETRHLTSDSAATKIADLISACRHHTLTYKKTDSTLRGN